MRPPELTDHAGRLRVTLGERLSGLYLYGSAVCGGYTNGVSDLDLIAVTVRGLEPADLVALAALHERFVRDYPVWRVASRCCMCPPTSSPSFASGPPPARS